MQAHQRYNSAGNHLDIAGKGFHSRVACLEKYTALCHDKRVYKLPRCRERVCESVPGSRLAPGMNIRFAGSTGRNMKKGPRGGEADSKALVGAKGTLQIIQALAREEE